MVASFAAENTFRGAITVPGIFVEAARTRPRHCRKPARIDQKEEKKRKKRLVVATGGCQILWVEMWQPQRGCVSCMGECDTALWVLQQHNRKYKSRRKEGTYVCNLDEGVGLWAVRRDVGGGVYRVHASRR